MLRPRCEVLGLLAGDYRRLDRLERRVIPRRCFMGVNTGVLRDKLPQLELPESAVERGEARAHPAC